MTRRQALVGGWWDEDTKQKLVVSLAPSFYCACACHQYIDVCNKLCFLYYKLGLLYTVQGWYTVLFIIFYV